MQHVKIFSGTSNEPLGAAIAQKLNTSLASREIIRFADGECRVRVTEEVTGSRTYAIQSLSYIADQNLVELCLLGSALKNLKATHITAVIPWMGYSKQDKEFRKGEAVSAHLVAKFIQAAGFHSVITLELHSETITPYFEIPVTELSTHGLFVAMLRQRRLSDVVVVSPDMGGKSRSERFAKEAGLPIVYLEKKRDLASGEVTVVRATDSVSRKNIIVFDDIINTGATVIKTSEFLKSHGAAHIYFMATHAVFAGNAAGKLSQSVIDEIIVTDTIAIPKEKQFKKLSIISVADLIAQEIRKAVG